MAIETLFVEAAQDAIPVFVVTPEGWESWLAAANPAHRDFLAVAAFKPKPGKMTWLPATGDTSAAIIAVVQAFDDRWALAGLPALLEGRTGQLTGVPAGNAATRAALAWALGQYRFRRYKKSEAAQSMLVWPEGADRDHVLAAAQAITLVRDLVNTPANDLGPAELANAARQVAAQFGAEFSTVEGDALLSQNFPAIHAVGCGSDRPPLLIDMRWGDPSHPRLTLVGKGVVFDTGGYDIKPSSGMLTMKKDMGGAAHALGLAAMIMRLGLKLRLRVLIPAVENSISGHAMRPSDIIATRAGLTVEIGNTDAEGRLVLADALAEACSEQPAAILDFATLTGAARVALGPDLPALFCNNDDMAATLLRHATAEKDPFWRMPLWQPYAVDLDSPVADTNNVSSGAFAGAITAALFLEKFVTKGTRWAHFDVFAWTPSAKPGRPTGGEAYGLHACLAWARELAQN